VQKANPNELSSYIKVYDEAFDSVFCQLMMRNFEALSRFQARNGRGIREGLEQSDWMELDITPFSDAGFQQLLQSKMRHYLDRYNNEVSLPLPIPESVKLDRLVIKRYVPNNNEQFQVHFDSLGPVANRYLVFLWYLNDVAEGGETNFPSLGMSVQPKQGRLLMFPPYWMFQHEGLPPISGEKFIFSTYYLF
jgi:prolyl 4-hydroxylase